VTEAEVFMMVYLHFDSMCWLVWLIF